MHPHTAATQGLHVRLAVLLLLAALGAAASDARAVAAADSPVPWTVHTAANDFGAHRPDYGYTIDPGGRIEDGLVVVNRGTAPLHLAVDAADAFTTSAGQLALRTGRAKPAGVGAWVQPDRDAVTVRPGESVEVPFAIAVPKGAAPGDYMGGIVTSPAPGGDADRRAGIRIRLRVGGALEPSLAVEAVHVGYAHAAGPLGKGEATVAYTIRNTGNAILTARQAVSVSGPFGRLTEHAGRVADTPPLLPGDTWAMTVPLDGVAPALRLTAHVAVVPLLTDAAGSTAPLAGTTASGHAWAIPWTLVALVVLVCVLVATGIALRRRRSNPPPDARSDP